ncbi:MAG: glycosyltransferase family 2 protein [Candidatus Omnitrophica bacterium]|nr:glycosyltransferase family 2 protein [Candidatus Omnitrophota bacterium]
MMKNLCALIPSYNEAKTIGGIVKGLAAKGITSYIIDDGSNDDTAAVAASEGAIVLRHDKNEGKGAALRDGFTAILKENFDAVLIMDGDGQHSLDDVDSFLKKMEDAGADIIIGNRMRDRTGMPFVRVATNLFMSYLISRLARVPIPDTQCGYRLLKRDVLKRINLETSNFEIESEMIIKAAKEGFKIESVPISSLYRDERSRINPVIDTIRFFRLLLRILTQR